jgi:serine/threonine protein kinase
MVFGTEFIVDKRYEVKEPAGSGAYGTVVIADDTNKNIQIAIKKIERAFEHKLFAKRTLRELKILRLLSHENIIQLKTIQKPEDKKKFNEIYAVFDVMETDLGSIIKSQQELSIAHIQFFLYQILRGMKYIHSAGILHRDLKPRNLLVNSNCDLKICDFGLARADIPELYEAGAMTDYISTRWYRAPELLLGSEDYSNSVDMWSIGCIFAEMLIRKPLLPGQDSENQLELIVELLGMPDKKFISNFSGGRLTEVFKNLSSDKNEKGEFKNIFGSVEEKEAVSLLKKMLRYEPNKRITIEKALEHPFLADLHYPPDEPTAKPVSPFDFDFEKYDLSIEETKELIYEEILLYHSSKAQKKYIANRKEYPEGILHLKYGKRA